ncbi:MAG: lytic transglycosylase domain-containing protein [Rhodobiaceae bacterium]|nr:lytic transglycosylase domain-containing protein [Rhodobiaceae bacterium]
MSRHFLYLAFILFAAGPAFAATEADPKAATVRLCGLLDGAADTHGVPREFFTRLIWTESRFNPNAISPKGAQGIAQFMPGTAVERGLNDPFDPEQALPASAHFLRDLHDQFGNWGLAAAGYNAGPDRVRTWLDGASGLPLETQNFVVSITGQTAESWSAAGIGADSDAEPKDCPALVAALGSSGLGPAMKLANWQPWGVQVAGHFNRAIALKAYDRLQRQYKAIIGDRRPMVIPVRNRSRGRRAIQAVRIGADSQLEAQTLCTRLRAAGATCVVARN